MKDFFKPEDFDYKWDDHVGDYQNASALIANEKLNKLIESWPWVYGRYENDAKWVFGGNENFNIKYRARLACIEEIPKLPCLHEPEEYNHRIITTVPPKSVCSYRCKKCFVELVAEWKEKV